MSEARQILESVISDFSPEKFIRFFREKNRNFVARENNYSRYNDNDFKNGTHLGEIKLQDNDNLMISAFEVQKPLSERAGKKAQYEKAKIILKATENQNYCGGIFIFYDANGNFRFSLVYPEAIGTRRQWNNFRRFTYFVSSSEDVTNKTFKQRIGDGDFSDLQKIKDAFSVEKVTHEFYEAIANWYFWAVEHSRFPQDAETEENGRNISVIRLITRIIFIWFMRERGLVPKALFEEKKIRDILHDIAPESSTYYKAILQNLFFATLSTKKEARQFRSEVRGHKGYNPDFDNQYVYRYHDLFKDAEDIKTYFGNVPFLNGGLFECLDDKQNGIYIDGFTAVKKNQPEVPNFLFFSDEVKADLNGIYGTRNKTYKVHGLLDTLRSFNFTIDENSPDDQDVALDPELLGRVFENLLASFNPETATTARKATGSYYTPREIVDYMVSESLKAYFRANLEEVENLDEKIDKLFFTNDNQNPFSKNESKKIVSLIENVKIVDPAVGSGAFPMGALHKLVFILNKVDPGNELWKQAQIKAAGKITDPSIRRETIKRIEDFFQGKNADYGRKLYLIQRCIYGVDIQQIAVEIAKLRFFIALLVDEVIDAQKDNWGIEPLPNLDFKIIQGNSLISNFMGIDFDADTAQTNEKTQIGFDFADADDGLIKTFEQKKIDFQNEPNQEKKKQIKDEIEDLLIQIFETRIKKQKADYFQALEEIEQRNSVIPNPKTRAEIIAKEKQKLSQNTSFDLESIEKQLREFTSKKKTKPFFPWRLYFAEVFEKGGFDVVIGNPPYLKERDNKKVFEIVNKSSFGKKYHQGKMDYWFYFLHKAIDLAKNEAIISYITSRYWLNSSGAKKLIERVANELSFVAFVDIGKLKVFEEVAGHHMVAVYKKTKKFDKFIYRKLDNELTDINKNENTENLSIKTLSNKAVFKNNEIILESSTNITVDTTALGLIGDISQGVVEATDKLTNKQINKSKRKDVSAGDGIFVINKNELKYINPNRIEQSIIKKYLDPNDVFSYGYNWSEKYLIYADKNTKDEIKRNKDYSNIKKHLDKYKEFITSSNKPYGLHRPRKIKYFNSPKIIFKGMFVENSFAYDKEKYFVGFSFSLLIQKDKNYDLKFILSILNSKFALDWFYKNGKKRGAGVDIGVEKLRLFPIKIATEKEQIPFISIVDKILELTHAGDYLENKIKQAKVKEYEKEINRMVYALYGLNDEEKLLKE